MNRELNHHRPGLTLTICVGRRGPQIHQRRSACLMVDSVVAYKPAQKQTNVTQTKGSPPEHLGRYQATPAVLTYYDTYLGFTSYIFRQSDA